MTKPRVQSRFDFGFMALEFRIRDWLHPPIKILREVGIAPGMTVLDFGCGPGGFSVAAARLAGPEGRVFAIDINPAALESVKRSAAREGLENIRTIPGDGLGEIPDGSVDFVLLYDVFHDFSDAGPILADLHRLLKADGMLSVSDHHLKETMLKEKIAGGSLFCYAGCRKKTLMFEKTGVGNAGE